MYDFFHLLSRGPHDLMEATENFPARYRVRKYPDRAALDAIGRCSGGAGQVPAAIADATRDARTELARKRRPVSFSDAAEANMQLAGQLWNARQPSCAVDDAVARALAAATNR